MTTSSNNRNKINRQNRIKAMLSNKSEESALSINDIFLELQTCGFKVTRKTVERDVTLDISDNCTLKQCGSNPAKYFAEGQLLTKYELQFNQEELQTLIVSLENLKKTAPSFIGKIASEVEGTIIEKLPQNAAKEFLHLKSITTTGQTLLGLDESQGRESYHKVLDAIIQERMIECIYTHYGRENQESTPSKRRFAPLAFHFVAGTPYVICYDPDDENQIKNIKLSRMTETTLIPFKVDRSYRAKVNLEYSIGGYGHGDEKLIDYEVIASKSLADRLKEHPLHSNQTIESMSDGRYKISFRLSDGWHIISHLAQYGGNIYKVSPESVFDEIKKIWSDGLKNSA